MNRSDVHELLAAIAEALERGEERRAAALLGAESQVFYNGFEKVAAELGYARNLLTHGDVAGAKFVVQAVRSAFSPVDVAARTQRAVDALEVGDVDLALEVLRDLVAEIDPAPDGGHPSRLEFRSRRAA